MMITLPILKRDNILRWKKQYNGIIVTIFIVSSFWGGMITVQLYRDYWQPLKFISDEIYYAPPGTLIYFGEIKKAIKTGGDDGVFSSSYYYFGEDDDTNRFRLFGEMVLSFEVMLLPGDEDYCFHLQGMPQSSITDGYMDEFCATIKDDAMIYDSPPI